MKDLAPYMDQAREWVNEWYPNLEGQLHHAKVREVARELMADDHDRASDEFNEILEELWYDASLRRR